MNYKKDYEKPIPCRHKFSSAKEISMSIFYFIWLNITSKPYKNWSWEVCKCVYVYLCFGIILRQGCMYNEFVRLGLPKMKYVNIYWKNPHSHWIPISRLDHIFMICPKCKWFILQKKRNKKFRPVSYLKMSYRVIFHAWSKQKE